MNVEDLHDFRTYIDVAIKQAKGAISNLQGGQREMALVHTKLQEAKMWIGKVLEENDSPLPAEFRDEAPDATT